MAPDRVRHLDAAAWTLAALRERATEDPGLAAPGDSRGEPELQEAEAAHVADEGLRHLPSDDRALDEVVRQAEGAGQPALYPVQHLLLRLGPVEVVVADGEGAL